MSVFFVEEPLAWISRPSNPRLRICGGCVRVVERGSRCVKCTLVQYCSKPCQTADWEVGGHRKECRFFQSLSPENRKILLGNPRLRLIGRLFIRLNSAVDDDAALPSSLEGARDAGEEWGPGGVWAEEDGEEYASVAEASWDLFRELYLNNSSYFRTVAKKTTFMEYFGKVCANSFPIIHYSTNGATDTGFGLYAKAGRYEHSCADAHLRYTTHGRQLRVLYASNSKEEEVRVLLESGGGAGLRLCRIPYTQAPLRLPSSQREEQLRSFAWLRCSCPACAAPPARDPEHALNKECPDCRSPLYYDPRQLAGQKLGSCLSCGSGKGSLGPEETTEIRVAIAKLRNSLALLPAKLMVPTTSPLEEPKSEVQENPVLELRDEVRPLLHPVANVLVAQLTNFCFQYFCFLVNTDPENADVAFVAAVLGKEVWAAKLWAGGEPAANDAFTAVLLSRLYGNSGWALRWVSEAVRVWEDMDASHPVTAELADLRDALLPPPADILADLQEEIDFEFDVDVDDPDNLLGANSSGSVSPRSHG